MILCWCEAVSMPQCIPVQATWQLLLTSSHIRCYQAINARQHTIIGSLVSIDRSLVIDRSIQGR